MKFTSIQKMSIYLELGGNEKKLGTLAWSGRERRAYFEYAAEFLTAPLLISPFHMMAASGLIAAPRDPFDGLHGLFNDSLPDGWGRLLLDRRLQRAGIDYNRLTPVDRLSAVGRTGMGALSYVPELPDDRQPQAVTDLDWFADQVELVQDTQHLRLSRDRQVYDAASRSHTTRIRLQHGQQSRKDSRSIQSIRWWG